ncbi:MAG TPA: protein-L-isoaspartate(D-aspartate) O-methyltransferase [Membranihabitans sp.]|nr:protein-L-isoaspartate(D-aspartate) O-methyltransferase [Membranihabitans sp.]
MTNFKDTYRHRGMRRQLIKALRLKGIENERLLEVMGTLPRHFFFDTGFDDWAYKDVAFPIGEEQTISQPYTVAYQTNLLEVQRNDKILEVGTGSGYQAAILYELGARVYTIERHESLYEKTSKRLRELGYDKIRTYLGDGYKGLPRFAPFDKILITAAPDTIPEELQNQLALGGYLVCPLGGQNESQQMIRLTKTDHQPKIERFDYFRFVPMVKGVSRDPGSGTRG